MILKHSYFTPIALVALLPLVTGCNVISSLNPFGGGGEEAPPASPVATPPPQSPAATPAAPNVPPSQTPFRDAVNKAMEAANAVQTAQSSEEWQAVVILWQEAIALMQQVPQEDPNYQTAQQKVTEYQKYLEYAQNNSQAQTGEATQPQESPATQASPSPTESPAASPAQ